MSFRYTGRVVIPSPNAERYATVCQFCNVGCGYDVYVWPAGEEGGLKPGEHGVVYRVKDAVYNRELKPDSTDFSRIIVLSHNIGTPWISEAMVVRTIRRDWRKGRGTGEWREVYVAQIPSPECPINMGNYSIRGGTNGERNWSPWNVAGARRLKFPMVRFGGRLEVVTWDYAIDLVARVVKGVIDRWGVESQRWGKEGHAILAHRMDHGGGGGGAMIENVTAGLFFFYGVRTAFARIHNRSFFGPENPAIGDAGPGAMNNSLHDLRLADVMVFWGANSYATGTVMFIEHALSNLRGATADEKRRWFGGEPVVDTYMIIVDPRKTETVEAARAAARDRVLHLAPEPGTDIVLANAIARVIYERYRGTVDSILQVYRQAAQRGFNWDENAWRLYLEEALEINRKTLDQYLAEAEKVTGVPRRDIERAAEIIGAPKPGGYPKRVWLMYEKGIIWN